MRGRAPRRPAPGREPGAQHPGASFGRRCQCRRGRSQRGHGLARRPLGPESPTPRAVAPRRGGLDGADCRAGGMEAAHLLPAADVLRHFSVTAEGGLSPAQVTSARERYGPNGESAGRAGTAGSARAAVSVSPQHRSRGAVHPHTQLSASAGGQEARAPETSTDALGAPGGAVRPLFRGWGGERVPGWEAGRLAPPPRSPASRPRDLHGPYVLTTFTDPIHSYKPTPIGGQRWIPAPHCNPPAWCRCAHGDRLAMDQPGALRPNLPAGR